METKNPDADFADSESEDEEKGSEKKDEDLKKIAEALVELDLEEVEKQMNAAEANPSPFFGPIDQTGAKSQLDSARNLLLDQYLTSLSRGGALARDAAITRLKDAKRWPLK